MPASSTETKSAPARKANEGRSGENMTETHLVCSQALAKPLSFFVHEVLLHRSSLCSKR